MDTEQIFQQLTQYRDEIKFQTSAKRRIVETWKDSLVGMWLNEERLPKKILEAWLVMKKVGEEGRPIVDFEKKY